ncbi:MAG TPA: GAF domain-containing protein [Aquabacterium sp.]|uniref:GAF domain-containing protein n=1 Tax=Aquabacterium sp. TaxID=1872578 RepID=UPI002E373709|nr:GAF domain-containing protein [Aquabacterium sp.]HEX5374164.1 GAF domain-containing protein [Aquabacterium sp.]
MTVCISSLRNCFEGAVPSALATCSGDGVPNIAYLSQVQYVDHQHVALTFQFFNKTRQNILANPQAVLKLADPLSGGSYALQVRYLRTETSGPLFESMKAKLAGIASHTGMADVFKLLGSDIYRVEQVTTVVPPMPGRVMVEPDLLPRLRHMTTRLNACRDLSDLLDQTLAVLQEVCGIEHTMILKLDECGERLFTVASRGYEQSGVGSEIPMGHGVIGVAARERTPIRISHMTSEYIYGKAVRGSVEALGLHHQLETAIPMPGLPETRSQLAVPILAGQQLYGVLYVESPQDLRFSYDDEDMLQILAQQFGWMARDLACAELSESAASESAHASEADEVQSTSGGPVQVRYFRADHSVFLDEDYLIKGVAGAIFWKLVQLMQTEGRAQFTNRELRLDGGLGLPDVADNLEARLVLLQRRLAERQACVQMHKTGRGRFALSASRPLRLVSAD